MIKMAKENKNLFQKALRLHQSGYFSDAEILYNEILESQPENIDTVFFLGTLKLQQGYLESARLLLEKVTVLKPDHAAAYNNLGTVLKEQGKPDAAVNNYNKSIKLNPCYAIAHCNAGNLLKELGRFDEAEASCRRAISLQPDYSDAHNNLAAALQKQGKHDEAIVSYNNAIKFNPESVHAHINRSSALLLTENFEDGWPEYEWRLRTKKCNSGNYNQAQWDGTPLNGRSILVHAEQGFGDTIQFVRYLPMVQERGGYVIFECQKNLIRLLKNCDGIGEIMEMTPEPKVNFDTHIHLLSLPGVFSTNMDSIPSDTPYIRVDSILTEQWKSKLANNNDYKIGIAWAGRPTFKDHYRSCSLDDFSPLAGIPGITFFSLQKGPASEEVSNPPEGMKIINLDNDLNDFADTAAVMNNLDLIISTDTAIVHLAGALGKPIWTLLHTSSDWRWFLNREDSPWYPSPNGMARRAGMRLFRQSRFNDWKGVFDHVQKALLLEISDLHNKPIQTPKDRRKEQKPLAHTAKHTTHWQSEIRNSKLDNFLQEAIKLHQIGNFSSAIIFYKKIIDAQPDNPIIYCNLGSAFQGSGRIDEASACYRKAIEFKPDYAMAHCNLGSVFHESGKPYDAVASYKRAIEISPDFAMAHNNLGTALKDLCKLDEAVESYRKAILLKPDFAEAHDNLGTAFFEQRKFEEAVICHNRAIRFKPKYADAYNNLGTVLQELCKFDEAVSCYRKAIDLKPNFFKAHNNLGTALQCSGKPEEALASYRQAIALKPDFTLAHVNRSFALLLTENFKEGWQEHKWRLKIKGRASTTSRQIMWDGKPLKDKTILIHAEQGFGDTIQFIRYLPMVKAKGGRVIFECQQSLYRLLKNCNGIDEIIEMNSGNKLSVLAENHVHLLDLPGIFETTLNSIPADIPYITPDPILVDRWASALNADNGFKIGIVWAGNPNHSRDRNRSCSLADFTKLTEIPDLSFYSLQTGPASVEAERTPGERKIINLNNQINDFADTAAVIANLDLIISVDTAVAHLAGALGKEVWALLPFAPDWRWLLKRDDSPWYPRTKGVAGRAGMRLFRQNQQGDWNGVFEQVKRELLIYIAKN